MSGSCRKIYIKPGTPFGSWTVLVEVESRIAPSGKPERQYLCRCTCRPDCNEERVVLLHSLRNGSSRSCGFQRPVKHGMSNSPEFAALASLKSRCTNPNDAHWDDYGGRGITVCERWYGTDGFLNFLADVGLRPSSEHSIDRWPNNDGNYESNNVRWATREEQQRNRRNSLNVTYRGETRPLKEWVPIIGKPYRRLRARLWYGWSIEDAFERPIQEYRKQIATARCGSRLAIDTAPGR